MSEHHHAHSHQHSTAHHHASTDAHNHHDHSSHGHSHIPNNKKILLISFVLITVFMLVEFVGGYFTHSLALISDAGHMLSDSVALGIALAAVFIGQKAASQHKSFGYQRFEIVAAALNGLALVLISLYILIEAIIRFQSPEAINIQGMLIISCLGLFINIVVAWMMFKGSDTENDLNMRSAFLHVLSDLFGSVGAIVAALCIYFFGWMWADPLASILVAILVLRSGAQVARQAYHILMQGTPDGFDINYLKQLILKNKDVLDVHDLHLWSLTSQRYILSCHIVVDADLSMAQVQPILHAIQASLQPLGIGHVTIQTETPAHDHPQQHQDDTQCSFTSLKQQHAHDHHTDNHDTHGSCNHQH